MNLVFRTPLPFPAICLDNLAFNGIGGDQTATLLVLAVVDTDLGVDDQAAVTAARAPGTGTLFQRIGEHILFIYRTLPG